VGLKLRALPGEEKVLSYFAIDSMRGSYADISVTQGRFEVFAPQERNVAPMEVKCGVGRSQPVHEWVWAPKTENFMQFRNINAPHGLSLWRFYKVFRVCRQLLLTHLLKFEWILQGFRSYGGLNLGGAFSTKCQRFFLNLHRRLAAKLCVEYEDIFGGAARMVRPPLSPSKLG